MPGEYLKHLLIRTPLERPAQFVRDVWGLRRLLRHREIAHLRWEPFVVDRAVRKILRRPDLCALDVGAHLGSTLSQITRLAPAGRHMAFEPMPDKAAWLRKKFPDVAVHEVALSDSDGTATFHVDEAATGFSSLDAVRRNGHTRNITVRTARLDTLLPPQTKPDFFKLDVEGGELRVLRGAEATLRLCRPVILFESSNRMAASGVTPGDVFDFLNGIGYAIRGVADFVDDGKALNREQFIDGHQYPFRTFNYVATA